MNIRDAQDMQRGFDAHHWAVNGDKEAKLRHIALHLAVLLGKIGRHCERAEHQLQPPGDVLTDEVAPDLLIYALQIANLFDASLEDLYNSRLHTNAGKLVAVAKADDGLTLGHGIPKRSA